MQLVVTSDTCSAEDTKDIINWEVIHHFGIPDEIGVDWGAQFCAHHFLSYFRCLGTCVLLSAMCHPETDGLT